LADTALDLAYALNVTLQQHGKPPLDINNIRPFVSLGGAAMLKLGFGKTAADPEYEGLRNYFLGIYSRNLSRQTRLFPGMEHVLDTLDRRAVPWGIVTNKPGWLTEPLLEALHLKHRASCIISGDTLPYSKPRPEPLLHACSLMDSSPENTVYVGDARRDIEAGKNAGMHTVLARYGYIDADDEPDNWGADAAIDDPVEILAWLQI
jgi:phosphoglycolate phosphatase